MSPSSNGNVVLVAALALAVGALLMAGMVMGVLMMAGHMGGGMMWGGGGNSPQTPVVADSAQISVDIRDFDFFPRDLTVTAGAQVTWTNRDGAPHTATSKGDWDTGTLKKGQSATLTFDTPDTYEYICTIHPSMKATLTVR